MLRLIVEKVYINTANCTVGNRSPNGSLLNIELTILVTAKNNDSVRASIFIFDLDNTIIRKHSMIIDIYWYLGYKYL